jgi:hypothetical protein
MAGGAELDQLTHELNQGKQESSTQ